MIHRMTVQRALPLESELAAARERLRRPRPLFLDQICTTFPAEFRSFHRAATGDFWNNYQLHPAASSCIQLHPAAGCELNRSHFHIAGRAIFTAETEQLPR
eukprot:s59_g22.t1